jgi:AcrR family transcriptional regulator
VPRPGRLERAKRAALDLAREGGYDAVTIPKVAERSGLSRANLYQHFESKDHLIAVAYAEVAKDVIGRPHGRALHAATAGERVLAYFDQGLDRALEHPQFVDAYIRAFARAPNDVIAAVPNLFGSYIEEVIGPGVRNRSDIALVLELVFSTLMTAVVGRGAPVEDVRAHLRRAVRVTLGNR